MMWVVLDASNRAYQILDNAPKDDLHPEIPVVSVDTAPTIGDLWDGHAFVSPSPEQQSVPAEIAIFPALIYLENMPGRTSGKSMFDDIEAAIDASDSKILKLGWQRASTLRRDSELVKVVANLVDPPFTDAELDALFIQSPNIVT